MFPRPNFNFFFFLNCCPYFTDSRKILMYFSDSMPYQDPLDGAVGGDELEDIGALRLHDDSEFPPMRHKLP